MRKFIVGLLLGLALSAAPTRADWGWSDMSVLKEVRDSVAVIAGHVQSISVSQRLTAQALVQQAQALERIASAIERRYTAPAEQPLHK